MIAAVRGSTRVVLFLGPPGVGKTLLLDDVLHEISGQFAACRINQPHISATELLQAIVMQLGTTMIEGDGNPTGLLSDVAAALDAAGSRAAPPMLVIDDAHLLTGATLVTIGDLAVPRAPPQAPVGRTQRPASRAAAVWWRASSWRKSHAWFSSRRWDRRAPRPTSNIGSMSRAAAARSCSRPMRTR